MNMPKFDQRTVVGLAVLFTTLAVDIYYMTHGAPQAADATMVGRILGGLETLSAAVVAFHFNTSSGSERKTELLARAQPVDTSDGPK